MQHAAVNWRWLLPSRMAVVRLQESQSAWVVGLVVGFGQVVWMPYVGVALLALPNLIDLVGHPYWSSVAARAVLSAGKLVRHNCGVVTSCNTGERSVAMTDATDESGSSVGNSAQLNQPTEGSSAGSMSKGW